MLECFVIAEAPVANLASTRIADRGYALFDGTMHEKRLFLVETDTKDSMDMTDGVDQAGAVCHHGGRVSTVSMAATSSSSRWL
jgi:hypothetical protein